MLWRFVVRTTADHWSRRGTGGGAWSGAAIWPPLLFPQVTYPSLRRWWLLCSAVERHWAILRSVCLYVRLSVPCRSYPRRAAALSIGTLAACSLPTCGLRTRPRTDVDPPRVELPSVGAYRLAPSPGSDNLFSSKYYIHFYSPVGRSIHNIKRNNKAKNTQNLN